MFEHLENQSSQTDLSFSKMQSKKIFQVLYIHIDRYVQKNEH